MRSRLSHAARCLLVGSVGLGVALGAALPASGADDSAQGAQPSDVVSQVASAQSTLVSSSIKYEASISAARQLKTLAAQKQTVADKTAGEARRLSAIAAAYVIEKADNPLGSSPMLASLLETKDTNAAIGDVYLSESVQDAVDASVDEALDARDVAAKASAEAKTIQTRASAAEKTASAMLKSVSAKAKVLGGQVDGTSEVAASRAQQDAWNSAAAHEWSEYKTRLAAASVKAPSAVALRDPARLPAGMTPTLGVNDKPVAGTATVVDDGKVIPVLPQETISMVDAAFAQVGKAYVEGKAGPEVFDCGGLVKAALAAGGTTVDSNPSSEFESSRKVPRSSLQIGDLVFLADKASGVQHVGLYAGGGFMVDSPASRYEVGVSAVPDEVWAVTRPSLGAPAPGDRAKALKPKVAEPKADQADDSNGSDDEPQAEADTAQASSADAADPQAEPRLVCNAPAQADGTGSAPQVGSLWTMPMAAGSYRMTASFGQSSSLWSTVHTGQDFAAPVGTPVYAASAGPVTIEHPGWAGNLVRIQRDPTTETLYAHLSRVDVKPGQVVEAGQQIGMVGALGNVTGPHLHFEIRVNGNPVDPMPLLLGTGPKPTSTTAASHGKYPNGELPDSAMCPLPVAGHRLRCDAAKAYTALAAAYQQHFKAPLTITDSYRSLAGQVALYAKKPTMAAIPGTSNHGWGLAVDLGGGIDSFGTEQHQWMVQNAPKFGWVHPGWAKQGGSRPEPWHWEFGIIS